MSIKNFNLNSAEHLHLETSSGDEEFMLRCIQIAKNGLGSTAPNPMVGAVIVHKGKIIGEGFTSAYGGPHAEVNAIASVKDTSLLKSATLYVTLEPCSHYGKTPPCADLIIKNGIPNIAIGLKDPHKKVAGQGIKKLTDAGCNVRVGILKEACAEHHKRFLTFHTKKRPYIILKWAETADGFMAPEPSHRSKTMEPFWITNERSRQLVHKWRSEEQGVLVGTNTALADNPKLNLRDWSGRTPIRIVLDRNLKIPEDYHVLDGNQPTIVYTEINAKSKHQNEVAYRLLDFNHNVPEQICTLLFEEQVQSIIIEGGLQTLTAFIQKGLWDEARIFKGASTFGKGVRAPVIEGSVHEQQRILTDHLTILKP